MVKRAIVLLLDSLGVGQADDAQAFDDVGSNTLGHILENFPNTKIPNLTKLGLLNILSQSSNIQIKQPLSPTPSCIYGFAQEISSGKDTPSGHWELMGCPVLFDWGYFTNKKQPFPQELLESILHKANISGSLGNCIGSGTDIINQYGLEHIKTKLPIFYTSSDSVFQIACSEEYFGLENLYNLCKIAREELYKYNIGRVIARPFIGDNPANFKRTGNRVDYSISPHSTTLLNIISQNNGNVISVGKVADIFANSGITKSIKSSTLPNLVNNTIEAIETYKDFGLIFTNFVDFDSQYGHRRDTKGYADALEYFDENLPRILSKLNEDDLLIITSDHGCDPTFKGNDHTREYIPILFYNHNLQPKNIGKRTTFADVGQSICTFLNLPPLKYGKSFL